MPVNTIILLTLDINLRCWYDCLKPIWWSLY